MRLNRFYLGVARCLSGALIVIAASQSFRTRAASESVPATSSFEEIWKKSQALRPEPSMDTTPVSVKVGGVSYRIPRNYISNLHFDFPVLKVTYPGFKPLTEETRGCFDPRLREKLGCTVLELNLSQSHPDKRAWLENWTRPAPPYHGRLLPRPGPEGFEIYDLGPDSARIETYRSESEEIFFQCQILNYNREKVSVCSDYVSLADGNAAWFFFKLEQIPEVRKFESGIRQLMAGFQTKE